MRKGKKRRTNCKAVDILGEELKGAFVLAVRAVFFHKYWADEMLDEVIFCW